MKNWGSFRGARPCVKHQAGHLLWQKKMQLPKCSNAIPTRALKTFETMGLGDPDSGELRKTNAKRDHFATKPARSLIKLRVTHQFKATATFGGLHV